MVKPISRIIAERWVRCLETEKGFEVSLAGPVGPEMYQGPSSYEADFIAEKARWTVALAADEALCLAAELCERRGQKDCADEIRKQMVKTH